ncbi:MAG TPA: pilus assembly protein TadG-related protein [Jatrophihabitans sp.]|nr:pilus assembly protein TadG-related protein [Jatrophihabitans sp.]
MTRRGGARIDWAADEGSTIPLVLGFFLIGLLMVAGAVMASDAYTKQRDLQSVCDGAALAAANSLDSRAARTATLSGTLPLATVQAATASYLARDPERAQVRISATLSPDGRTVHAACTRHTTLAFGAVIGHRNGIDVHATASARSVLR